VEAFTCGYGGVEVGGLEPQPLCLQTHPSWAAWSLAWLRAPRASVQVPATSAPVGVQPWVSPFSAWPSPYTFALRRRDLNTGNRKLREGGGTSGAPRASRRKPSTPDTPVWPPRPHTISASGGTFRGRGRREGCLQVGHRLRRLRSERIGCPASYWSARRTARSCSSRASGRSSRR
jgi:hypothetical protein